MSRFRSSTNPDEIYNYQKSKEKSPEDKQSDDSPFRPNKDLTTFGDLAGQVELSFRCKEQGFHLSPAAIVINSNVEGESALSAWSNSQGRKKSKDTSKGNSSQNLLPLPVKKKKKLSLAKKKELREKILQNQKDS